MQRGSIGTASIFAALFFRWAYLKKRKNGEQRISKINTLNKYEENKQLNKKIPELDLAVVIGIITINFLKVVLRDEGKDEKRLVDSFSHLLNDLTLHSGFIEPTQDAVFQKCVVDQNQRPVIVSSEFVLAPIVIQEHMVHIAFRRWTEHFQQSSNRRR